MPDTTVLSRRSFCRGAAAAGAIAALGARAGSAAVAPPADPKSAWKIGCFTRPWDRHDYRTALDAIAEAGYSYAGLMTAKSPSGLVISAATTAEEAARVGEEAKKRGLKIPSVYGGDIPVKESLEAGIAAMKRLIDNCAAAGATSLMMGGTGDPKLNDIYYKAVAETCAYAAEKNIGITVKPHGGLNATGPQCRALIAKVGHPNFRLWYDPGNIFYYSDAKLDPVDDAATVDGLVAGMSVKDYRHPKDVMLTPGTGQVDFKAVMARLKKGGFTSGPLVVETLRAGELPVLAEEAVKARKFVEAFASA